MTTRTQTGLALLAAAVLSLTLAGCTTTTPQSAPQSAPQSTAQSAPQSDPIDPAQQRKDTSIEEAKQAYRDYIDVGDKMAEDGYHDQALIDDVEFRIDGDSNTRITFVAEVNNNVASGVTIKGKTILGTVTAVDYTPGQMPDDIGATVKLLVCYDGSHKTYYVNGEPQEFDLSGAKGCTYKTMKRSDERWLVGQGEGADVEWH